MTTNRQRQRARAGHTLIEMIVVIGVLTIVLGLCAGLIHTLLRLDRAGRQSLNDSTTLDRLSRQFRRDVHSSREAKPGEPGALELSRGPEPSVSYEARGGRLVRTERDGKIVLRREAYAVSRLGPATFRVDGPVVRLVLARRPPGPSGPARGAVAIEATLDKDRNLSGPAEARP